MRAVFQLAHIQYNLPLTDFVWEPFLNNLAPGIYTPEDVGMPPEERLLFTVSLGEPAEFDGACYKLVAAVVELPTALIQAGSA